MTPRSGPVRTRRDEERAVTPAEPLAQPPKELLPPLRRWAPSCLPLPLGPPLPQWGAEGPPGRRAVSRFHRGASHAGESRGAGRQRTLRPLVAMLRKLLCSVSCYVLLVATFC